MLTFTVIDLPVAKASGYLQISPTEGPTGTSVGIHGADFGSSATVIITFDGVEVTRVRPAMFGLVNTGFTVTSTTLGPHTVTATGSSEGSASVTFTVTEKLSTLSPSNVASITLSSTQGTPGTTVTVTGVSFGPGNSVNVNFDTEIIKVTTADTTGAIKTDFTIPPAASSGAHTVSALDAAGAYASTTFTVNLGSSQSTIGPYSTYNSGKVVAPAGFWSPMMIGIVVAIAVALALSVTFLYRRRGKQEPLPEEVPPPVYKPLPTVPIKRSSIDMRFGGPQPSKLTSPVSYNRQSPIHMKICRYCKKTIKDDYNICPYCRKRLK